MHILVVDDKPSVIEFLEKILLKEGHTYETAHNGLAGLEKAQENIYDLFIIDHLMPIMNGVQLCKNLSGIKSNHNKPIIFMTTLNKQNLKNLPEASLFSAVIEKPLEEKIMVELINLHLTENTLLHSL